MDKLKCPRCKNEELKGNENYCPVCGLELKEGTALEVKIQEQLIVNGDKLFIHSPKCNP